MGRLGIALWAALAVFGLGAMPVIAGEFQVGAIKISDPWVRESPIGASSGGGYLRIMNTGSEADRLVSVQSPTAKRIDVREVVAAGDSMSMRVLSDGLEIPPGTSVQLRWESFHLLFVDLTEPFKADQPFEASLNFAKAGPITVRFEIRPRIYW